MYVFRYIKHAGKTVSISDILSSIKWFCMALCILYIIAFHWLQCRTCTAQHQVNVSCDNVYECANMRAVGTYSGDVYNCMGEQSCVGSTFINLSVNCVGTHSCENTSIAILSQNNNLIATAAFALANAIITFTPYKDTSSITLSEYYAVLNTTIYCINDIENGNCGSIEINCNGYGCYGNSTNYTNHSYDMAMDMDNKTLSHYTVNKNIADCISIGNNGSRLNHNCVVYHGNPYSIIM